MKNIIIPLLTGVVICLSSPVCAMISDEEQEILEFNNHKIHNETSLNCTRSSQKGLGVSQIDYEILKLDEEKKEKIGEIWIQCYPESVTYYYSAPVTYKRSTAPIVHLCSIKIEEEYRRKYHGTQAMEALIMDLQEDNLLQKNVEMWLEYSSLVPGLKEFYESFGFEETNEPSIFATNEDPAFGITIMKLKLSNAKFPFHAKQMEKK